MKQRTAETGIAWIAAVLALICLLVLVDEVNATNYNKEPKQEQGQAQDQHQGQEQTATGGEANSQASSDSSATASNDGVQVGGDSVENNSSTVVLVPNNNTESCVRVFGLAFGKNGESGAIGFPWRSAKCDYEQAADDAFAAGERDLGWFWKCQNKSLYKRFQGKDEEADTAIDKCHLRMLSTTSTDDVVRRLEERLQATENALDLERTHKAVCDESLERCKEKAFGGK